MVRGGCGISVGKEIFDERVALQLLVAVLSDLLGRMIALSWAATVRIILYERARFHGRFIIHMYYGLAYIACHYLTSCSRFKSLFIVHHMVSFSGILYIIYK